MGKSGKFIIFIAISFFVSIPFIGAKSKSFLEPQPVEIVTMPTAGLISKGEALFSFVIFGSGGINFNGVIGLLKFINFGLGYGGTKIISDEAPVWNEKISIKCKLRALNESFKFPAFAIGFDSQGYGEYGSSRYYFKSPGIFVVASKNYYFLGGDLSFHIGTNYSLLENNDNPSLDLYIGLIKSWKNFYISGEYRAGFDDRREKKNIGYLNFCGSSLFINKRAKIDLLIMDTLNKKNKNSIHREIRVGFITDIF